MSTAGKVMDKDSKVPLLQEYLSSQGEEKEEEESRLAERVWVESKKLWHIVGPAIFSRIASYSMLVITQAFAGHLGDLELAAISICNNVIVGFDFGLLVGTFLYLCFPFFFSLSFFLMLLICYMLSVRDGERFRNVMRASFWSQKVLHVGCIHATLMDSTFYMLCSTSAYVFICFSDLENDRTASGSRGAVRGSGDMDDTASLQLCFSVPSTEIPTEPAEDSCDRLGGSGGSSCPCVRQLVVRVQTSAGSGGYGCYFEFFMVGSGDWVDGLHSFWWVSTHMDWFLH